MKKSKKKVPEIENISEKETYIKCERVNLKSCNLQFIPQDKVVNQNLHFSLIARVFEKLLLSELNVQVVNFFPENNQFAQILTFSLVGVFTSGSDVTKDVLGDFGKSYTLSILWPYAREFSQDMFQRTGFTWECLPVINAQDTTMKMIENGEIKVEFQDTANQES